MATKIELALDSGTRLGPYEVLAPAGAGGMGEVYRARDTRLDRLVAIKVLPADSASSQALERFEREAKAIAALNHPGICAIHDIGTTPVPFLVMELLEGETLHQRLQRGALDIPVLIDTALPLADALAAAHAKGIVHRDLKPANIFLTAHGPKILDFGLARVTEAAASADLAATAHATLTAQAPLTDAGVAVGTVAYMSPEQLRGDALDARTDLFSLGLVLYEMATGRRAFGGSTNAVTSASILHEQPVAPRELRADIPSRLEQTILTLLEKDRHVRTQSASELRADLTRLKRELSRARANQASKQGATVEHSAPVPTTAVPSPPSSSDAEVLAGVMRRHRGAAAMMGAVLLVVLASIGYLVRSGTLPSSRSDGASGPSIADLQVEQLTTSGTASAPVISPDGSYVVYIERGSSQDSLRVRQVVTGSNVEIARAERGTALRGATITPDGAFVNFVRQVTGQPFELWQVPLLGGGARRLLVGGRVGFSPRGDQMAYVRATGTGGTELVVASSDGSSERVLASRQLPLRFWPAGADAGFAPAWSPDGATIAAIGAREGESAAGQVVLVDVKSGAVSAIGAGPSGGGTGVAWLTDDALLLSMLDKSSAPMQLWVLSRTDGTPRRLTNDTSQYFGVSLTTDRDSVVTGRRDYTFDIWTSDVTGTNWKQAVPTKQAKGPVSIGVRWIGDDLIYSSSASYRMAVSRWHTSTGSEETLAHGAGRSSVSRDGSRIMFYDYDSRELLTMDTATGNRVAIRREVGTQEAAHLTPDGRYYVRIAIPSSGPPAIVLTSLDGTNSSRTITAERVRMGASLLEGGRVEVSPDGRWVAFPSIGEGNQPVITVCDLAACSPRRTFSAPGARWRWMPDSAALAYVDTKTLSDLWIQPLDGSVPRQLTHFTPDGHEIWDFDWSADGRRLAVARGRMSADIVLFRGLRGKK